MITMGTERIQKVADEVIRCPVCGEQALKIAVFLYDAPYVGKIVVQSGRCSSCGFKWSNVGLAEYGKPKKLMIRVNSIDTLNALVVKTAEATIKIPELGVEITPGPAAQGYITTVEGVLHRILEHIPVECLNEESNCYDKVKRIKEAADGRLEFTLVIEDPTGRSAISGKYGEVIEEPL